MADWVELTKVNGEIDAQLVAGSLENEGIPTRLQKSSGEWRYGAADAFVLVAVYVPDDRVQEASDLLQHPSIEAGPGGGGIEASDDPTADPFVRSRSLRWWIAALILVGLLLAFVQSDVMELLR